MLSADKDALLAEMKRGYLALREKEIFFINDNYRALGRQAALIAGFVVITLTNLVVPSNTPTALKGMFFLALCASLSYGLIAVSNSMLINVYGVGKALRGGDSESILATLEGMREERRPVYVAFGAAVLFFELMVIAVIWIEMERELALVATLIMVLGMIYIAVCGNRMYHKFKIRKEDVTDFEEGRFLLRVQDFRLPSLGS